MSLKEDVIAHWKRMRENAQGVYANDRERPSGEHCAFCRVYCIDCKEGDECKGCPIQIATSADTCTRGPYLDAQAAWCNYRNSNWAESQRDWWQLKADVMIKFLEELPDDK